jgi:hypothetical protein
MNQIPPHGRRVDTQRGERDMNSDLFGHIEAPYNGEPPHQTHSDTSREAAARIKYRLGKLHYAILKYLYLYNATDEEMQNELGMPANTQRPRRRELELMGYVVDSGDRHMTKSGRMAVVWTHVVWIEREIERIREIEAAREESAT